MGSSSSTQSLSTGIGDPGSNMVSRLTRKASKFLSDNGVSTFAAEFIKNLYKAGSAVALSELEARAKNDKGAKIFYDSLKQTTAGDELTGKAMVGGCYEAFAMSRASKAGGAELDSALAIGGCGCSGLFVGAADMDLAAVKSYSSTANASAKDALVNNIIQSLGSLGLKYDANAVSSQEKLRSLINSLPSSFKSDAASQTKTIGGIVGVINKAFGETIIEPSMSPEESAKRILEVLHSLTAGMHSEYLMVYSDIITTIKNLRILTGALEDSLKKIDSRIKDKVERDPGLANLRTAVDLALGESKRQLAMLEGLMNTTLSGSDKSIAKLLEKVSSMEDIEKLSHVGDKQFGKTIHDILTGMGVTANLSIVINNALKTVGMTLDQYAKTSSVSQLLEKVEAGAHKLKDDDEAEKFFKAVKTLTTNLWRAGDFSKYTSQSGEVSAAYEGAAEYEATPVERQIKNRKNIRDLIFTAFNKKVQEGFARLISTIDVLSVKIGTDVPITTELDAFRSSLSRIDNNLVYHKNIYYALIGYYNDSLSKSKREEFIAELKVVKTQAEIVASKPEFSSSAGLFNEVISSINAITALIDQYTDEIAAKFGSAEVSDPNTNIDGGCDACDDAAEVLGGDDFEIKPAAVAFKSVHNIHDAVVKFDYRFKVAQIRRNLKATSAELDEYSKDYDKLVTNSIYEIMADEKKKYNTLRAQLDEGKFGRSADYVSAVNKYTTAAEVDAQKAAALKILDSTWKTKEKFWATVEAVDRYMQVFTDSLVKNPEDVQDIKSMLDSIEIISDWYTDATGNSAAGVFDYFPRKLDNAFADYPDESYRDGPEHYYKRIGNKYSSASAAGNVDQSYPGNPYLVADPANASGAIDQVKKTFEGLSVLKNLISVFVHVGSKFGGEELRTKTFMSPAQMYNNLVEYIQASSFAQGYGLFDAAGTFKDDLPLYFNDFKRIGAEFTDITKPAQATTVIAAGAPRIVDPDGHIQVGHARVIPAGPGAGGVYAPPATADERIEQFRQRWGIWMRSIQPELGLKEGFGFKMEDEYFMLMIKSLAAKIFTVVGMYEVLDRPMEFNGLSPIRMTIGGAEGDSIPKIDETVTPLYLRLTLLAQFYRKIFSFTSAGDEEISGTGYDWKSRDDLPRKDKTVKISMVPDIMGTFAGFIRLMFRKIRGVDPDNFSDDDIKEIINEVNTIYSKLKDKYTSDPIAGIIQEFVAEVNRRYAIVSKEERNAYEAEFGSRYDRLTDRGVFDIDDRDAQMPIDIPLLPGEDEAEVTKLAEFQRRLESSTDPKIVTKLSNYKITPDHQKLVRDFRCAIDKFFDNPEESTSFDGPINNVQRKLKIESRDDQRFKLVASLIRGTDAYTKIDGSKYVMFHETVIGQLNLLSGIHSMLSRFKLIAQLIDIKWLEKEFVTWIGSLPNGGNVANACNTFISYILIKLVELGLISSNTDKFASDIIFAVLGAGSNTLALGGNGVVGAYIIKKTADIADNIDRDTPFAVGANGVLDTAGGGAASHLLGVLNGVHKSELNKPEHANKLQTVFRYLFDRKFIMKILIESLFGITSDLQGLVQISWDRNKLSVNMGGIKKLVLDLFESVGYFVDALRPQLDKQFINEYTNKANAGSLYWLQEQLIEKIIEGRDARAATGNNPALSKYDSLERVAQNISNTYKELTREWTVNGTRLSSAGNSLVTESPASRDTYDKVLAEIIFYDGSKPESGIASSKSNGVTYISEEQADVIDYIHDPFEALHFMGPQGSQTIDTRYIHRFKQLYGFDDKFTNNRSALFMFNQLVAKFIKSFYDPSSQKIYSPLLSQFANGIFSRAVSDHTYAYPDTAPAYFLKFVSGENVVLSSEHNFKSIIKPDQIDKVDTLASIVASYLKYKPGGNGSVPRRENRFNLSDPLLSGTYQMQIGVGPGPALAPILVGVQKLYCLLALFAAAKSIRRVIKGTGNDGTVVPGGVDPGFTNAAAELISVIGLVAAGNAAAAIAVAAVPPLPAAPPVDLNFILSLYGANYNVGNKPSTEAIVDYLLSLNGGALGTTIEQLASCGVALDRFHREDINASNMTRAIANAAAAAAAAAAPGAGPGAFVPDGDATSSQGLLYAYALANQASKAFQYLDVVDRFLTLNGNIAPVNNWYSISDIVASKIPYKVPAAAPSTEINFVANIFASMIIAFASRRSDLAAAHAAAAGAAGGANVAEQNKLVANWNQFKSELFRQNQGSSVYVPPAPVQPKTDVKRDDIVGAVNEDFLGAFRAPNMNNDYIILARSEQVPGALKPGNVGALSGAVGKAGILQDRPGIPGISSDSRLSVTKFGNRMDPDGEHVLFSSIANILKSLYQSRNSTQGTVFLHESIADVALYMKEKFRANLPAFKNLFNELRHKCEFTKKLLEQSELNLTRDFSIMRPTHNPWPYVLKDPVVGNSETKSRFGGILDTIIQGCNTLVAACEQVLREVGDDPKYLEIHNGSIKDYKAQYGNEPFMPITSMLRMLVNSNDASVSDLMPVHGMGEEQFKLMYGIRGLFASLQSDPMSDNLPGFGTIVEQFNTLLDPKLQVSKERCDQFVKVFVKSLRFLYESKHLKGTITPFVSYGRVNTLDGNKKYNRGLFTRRDLVITEKDNSGADRIAAAQSTDPDTSGVDILLTNKAVMSISTLTTARGRKHIKPVFAIAKPLADILRLSESSDRDARVRELVEYIKSDVSGRKNSKEIQNIIDLNIVPINIHALRREIPLVNLYNYAYTFDRMIIELYYGLRSDAARKLIAELCDGNNVNISSAKDMLVSLLINPYRDLRSADTDLWNTHAKGMLVGVASEAELGRPKFLSDQLYNKAVFGEMYISDMDRNEVGPAAAEVMNRKPTKEKLLTFASDRARAAVFDLYGGNALGAGIVNVDDQEFIKYMDATVKMYFDNPKLTIADGAAKLSTRAQPVADFNNLPTANNQPSHYKLAYVSCMWAKISVAVGSYIANNVVNNRYNTSILNNISDVAAWLMIAVSKVTSRQVGAAHPALPVNASEFSAEVMTQLAADINARALPRGASGVIDINATAVKKHIKGILELFAENVHIVIVLANRDITTGYSAAAPVVRLNDKAKSMFTYNYNIPDRTIPYASLHWLDIDKQVESRDRTQLSGLPDRSESMVHAEDVSQIRDILALFGRARFDTRFIRNLIFIVNLFRSVRVKLQRDLTYSRDIIQRSAAITRNPITEFTGNMVDANQSLASSVAWSKY